MSVTLIEINGVEWDSEDVRLNLLWLQALEDAGVENWEGYDFARKLYRDMLKETE